MRINFQNHSSVPVAKHRLQNILTSDRISSSPELMCQMQDDIFGTLSKYIDIKPSHFEFQLTRTDIHIRYAGEK